MGSASLVDGGACRTIAKAKKIGPLRSPVGLTLCLLLVLALLAGCGSGSAQQPFADSNQTPQSMPSPSPSEAVSPADQTTPPAAPSQTPQGTSESAGAIMKITSAAFSEGGNIPRQYTCDGANVSPPLAWTGLPNGTQSLALIADDPDAPSGTWIHWVVFNVPAQSTGWAEGVPAAGPDGMIQGISSFQKPGYGGPCPPSGTHRYYFKLYALDTLLSLQPHATARDLQSAMAGHILAEAQLMGRYRRG